MFLSTEEEDGRQSAECAEDDDLQDDTGDDDAVTVLKQVVVVFSSRGGDATADGLDDQTRNVGGDEEKRVEFGTEGGEGRGQGGDDVFEG